MNQVDKITKESRIFLDSIKDTFSENVVSAARSHILELDDSQLQKLLAIFDMSVSDGFQKAVSSYQHTVKLILK
jgi:hypothetical protein